MERRSFLKWATHGLGVLFGTLLGLPALAYLIDPRNRAANPGAFKTLIPIKDLEIGKPTEIVIRDVRRDAWTLHPNDVIGRVWLIRRDEIRVEAYTTICPHLGCSINFQEGKDGKEPRFVCPCHGGTFDLNGELPKDVKNNPAPRGMDRLECRRDPDHLELLQVKYQNFKQGEHTAIPKT